MAGEIKVALLWHMHQPDYRDSSGIFTMPWVFLHAIKDYYDMPYLLSQSQVKASFNLTPILIEQLDYLIKSGYESDRFLKLWIKEPNTLSSSERQELIKLCHTAQYSTMVSPLPRFCELYKKKEYSDSEIVDLEICFILSWCGAWLRTNEKSIQELITKGRDFNSSDKQRLLKTLFNFLPKILPLYDSLQKRGQISISTTPYSHPILPLLIDTKTANKSYIYLPSDSFSLKEDAKRQIQKAKEIYKEHFYKDPTGFWPAEGAIDPKSVELFVEANIKWIASDEVLLRKSGINNPYKPYEYNGVKIFFRDHFLSDLIGFRYRYIDPKEAVEDFKQNLQNKKGICFIILDGENAWEYYPNNGILFLQNLYKMLQEFETLHFDELLSLPAQTLNNLASGSWIGGDFSTWIGDTQKNRAWELLFQTKLDLKHHHLYDKIENDLLVAEGSDWFWWYGKGHYTPFAKNFDKLYRGHLISIYKSLNLPPPSDLFVPIFEENPIQALINEPKEKIHPTIDGRVSSFFEWLGSGMIDERNLNTTMQESNIYIERIYWGCDEEMFYFRIDSTKAKELELTLFFEEEMIKDYQIAQDEIIEIAVSKELLKKKTVEVRFELSLDGSIVGIFPSIGRLFISKEPKFEENWFV